MVALAAERTLDGPKELEIQAAQPWLVALLRSRHFFILETDGTDKLLAKQFASGLETSFFEEM